MINSTAYSIQRLENGQIVNPLVFQHGDLKEQRQFRALVPTK
jgi:hypothetical protein